MSNSVTHLTFTAPLPSAGSVSFKATKKGVAKSSAGASATGVAHIYSINTVSGTTIEKEIASRKLHAELNTKLGAAERALQIAHPTAAEIRFNFPRGIVQFKQGKKLVTVDLIEVKKVLGKSYQPIQELLDTAIKINPAFKKRNYQPIAHSLGNRFGSKQVLKHSNPVLQAMNRSIKESAQDAIKTREQNQQGTTLKPRERNRLFSRMAAAQTMHEELKNQVDKKVKKCETLSDRNPTKIYWKKVQEEIEDIDRPGLMEASALMPHVQTSQAVARMARQVLDTTDQEYRAVDEHLRYDGMIARGALNRIDKDGSLSFLRGLRMSNKLPPIDRDYAVDRGALLFSGLSAAEGRIAYAAHYDKHHIRPKQESLTGLVLRAAVRDEDQGEGLKSAWVNKLNGTAKDKKELEAMVDRAVIKANASKKKVHRSKTAPAKGETLAQKWEKSFALK